MSLKRISWWFRTSQDQNVTGRECAPFILSCLLLRETKIATIHPLLILMYVELLNVQVKGQSRVGACVSDGELRLQVTGPVALLAGSLGSEPPQWAEKAPQGPKELGHSSWTHQLQGPQKLLKARLA